MAIRGNQDLKNRLQEVLDISQPTMSRKLAENSDDFTKAACLKEIREYLSLTDAEILEESEPVQI